MTVFFNLSIVLAGDEVEERNGCFLDHGGMGYGL